MSGIALSVLRTLVLKLASERVALELVTILLRHFAAKTDCGLKKDVAELAVKQLTERTERGSE